MSNRTVDFGVLVRKLAAAGRSQKGLGFPIDYLELEPQALANLGEKLRAVLGGSARLGRDQAGARDPSRAHLVPADPQRVERARYRRFRQPTRLRQSLAQANDARKRIDHAKAFRRRPRDEQPAIVRAQVQRGVEPLRRAAPRRPVGGGEFRRRRGIWAQRRRLSQFQTPSAPARGPRSERTFEIERSIVRKGCKSFCALVKMLRRESIGRSATTDAPEGTARNKASIRRSGPCAEARRRDSRRSRSVAASWTLAAATICALFEHARSRPPTPRRLVADRFRVSWKIRIERSRLRRRLTPEKML